jgi:hypothetical protein
MFGERINGHPFEVGDKKRKAGRLEIPWYLKTYEVSFQYR